MVPNKYQFFFALMKAGLWEQDVKLSSSAEIELKEIYRLSEEQSVVGLVAAGLEHVVGLRIPKEDVLTFIAHALQLEQRNKEMNSFVAELVDNMRAADIYTLLIKGQGIAQCYERPLWRACGDIDLLLSEENYSKAKSHLISMSSSIETEDKYTKHLGMMIGSWEVELHGNLRSGITKRIDKALDKVQGDIFFDGNVRSWLNGNTLVFLPSADNDVVYVFAHILQHFFKGGIGLRQICDWCRLLWIYKNSIMHDLLEKRLYSMGLMSEWKAFAYVAVNTLGMPADAMPFYSSSRKWKRKASRIINYIIDTGNFGHKRDESYLRKYSGIKRKIMRFNHITKDTFTHFFIFPLDSIKVWWGRMMVGLRVLVGGE